METLAMRIVFDQKGMAKKDPKKKAMIHIEIRDTVTNQKTYNARSQSYGSFPYEEGFKSITQPSEVSIASVPSGINSAKFTDKGLMLTPAIRSQFGAVFINSLQFKTINGIKIEFEYMIYGGDSIYNADGLSLFLFDASVDDPTIGTKGAGLGYTFNRANNFYSEYRFTGLTGAYLGIGFDNFGNFKGKRFQPESRVNGLPDGRDLGRSHVTLRGAKGQIDTYYKGADIDGYTGYPVLITQSTISSSLNRRLNIRNGMYSSYLPNISTDDHFYLRGGKPFDENQPDNAAYRKAVVELYPWVDSNTNAILGKLITVKIQAGAKLVTVIHNFEYPESLRYIENSYSKVSTGDMNNLSGDYTATQNVFTPLDSKAPEYVRIGFAASTGEYYDNHYIKNLRITLPSSAIAVDDEVQTPFNTPITISPLTNDIGFTGPIKPDQIGNSSYLNPFTFRFLDNKGNLINGDSYTSSEGIWIYKSDTGNVTFTPAVSFHGIATVKYDIKAGLNNEEPYIDESYRSLPATIEVSVTPPGVIVTNLMLQPLIVQ